MKHKDFKTLSKKELEEKIIELKKELMKERANIAMGKYSQKTTRVREVKRMIAKITATLAGGKVKK